MSDRKHERLDGCNCPMCKKIDQYRAEHPEYAHRPGCDCGRCSRVEELADAREAGQRQAETDNAYKYGYDRTRDK
jgi:hypothetical protein